MSYYIIIRAGPGKYRGASSVSRTSVLRGLSLQGCIRNCLETCHVFCIKTVKKNYTSSHVCQHTPRLLNTSHLYCLCGQKLER